MLRNNTLKIVLASAILITAFIFYIPTLTSGFIWDDLDLLFKPLKAGENPYSFLFGGKTFYRPVVRLSLALDYSLWHMDPVGYHMTNIVLHMIISFLVFVLTFQLFRMRTVSTDSLDDSHADQNSILWPSFFPAMVFAVHPIHIESVAWISGRTDLLSTLFFLLAFLSFVIYERKDRNEALVLSGIFFLFSLFSKENAIAFIGVALIYGLTTRMPKKNLLLTATSLMLVLIVYFIFRNGLFLVEKLVTSPGTKGAFFAGGITFSVLMKKLIIGLGYYFGKLIAPLDLSLVPRFPQGPLYYLVFVLVLLVGILCLTYGRMFEMFLLCWIILTLLPSLPIMFSRISEPLAERYLYLPSVGFVLLLGSFIFHTNGRKKIIVIFISICVFYAVSGGVRLNDWQSDLTIWEDTVQKNPFSFHARLNYGAALIKDGQIDKARTALWSMLDKRGLSDYHYSQIHDLLGVIELEERDYERAEAHLKRSVSLNRENAYSYYNLGLVYDKRSFADRISDEIRKKLIGKAIYNYEKARRISPGFISPAFNIGVCLVRLDDFEKAEKYFNMVIEADPQSEMANDAAKLIHLMKSSRKDKVYELLKIAEKEGRS